MLKKLAIATAIMAAGTTTVAAQQFSGAELGLNYTDSPDLEDLGGVSYFGAAEVALGFGVSVAVDATAYNYDIGISDISNLTAHVLYNVDPSTAIGGFFGQDNAGDADNRIIGAEVAYDFGLGDVQGYIGSASDDAGEDVTIYGAAATYELANGFGIVGSLNSFSGDDVSASAVEIGGTYQLAQGPTLGARLGRQGLGAGDDTESEFYLVLQASVALGPNAGTTFGRRGAFEVLKIGIEE